MHLSCDSLAGRAARPCARPPQLSWRRLRTARGDSDPRWSPPSWAYDVILTLLQHLIGQIPLLLRTAAVAAAADAIAAVVGDAEEVVGDADDVDGENEAVVEEADVASEQP